MSDSSDVSAPPVADDVPVSAPTAEELAIAARVLSFYSTDKDHVKQIQSMSTESARTIRKSAFVVADHIRGNFKSTTVRARHSVEKLDQSLKRQRRLTLKQMDREMVNSTQLRHQRNVAFDSLIEPMPIATVTGPAVPQLTSEPAADASSGQLVENNTSQSLVASAPLPDLSQTGIVTGIRDPSVAGVCDYDNAAVFQARFPGVAVDPAAVDTAAISATHEPDQKLSTVPAALQDAAPMPRPEGVDVIETPADLARVRAAAAAASTDTSSATVSDDTSDSASNDNAPSAADLEYTAMLKDADPRITAGQPWDPAAPDFAALGWREGDAPEDFKELRFPLACYVCKQRYYLLHHHYDRLCPPCARLNWYKRNQTADLRGYTVLLTGSRVKIGFECGLRLLRCGARVIATSRFPHDTAKRYSEMADYNEWRSNLHVYGLDLRDLKAVMDFTDMVGRVYGSLDAIINNAAQTVRRPVFYYQHLLENELRPHAELADRVREVVKGDAHSSFMELAASATRAPAVTCVAPAAGASVAAELDAMQLLGVSAAMRDAAAAPFMTDIAQAVAAVGKEQQAKMEDVDGGAGGSSVCVEEVHADEHKQATSSAVVVDEMHDHDTAPATVARASSAQPNAALLSQLAVVSQDSDAAMKRYFPEGFRDVTGQQLDLRPTNSWELLIDQVEPGELVETFAINALAPFIINSRLIPLMRARADADAGADKASRPRFIVNVSAMEGKFYRFKGPQHVHTNMAKAALNMLTRTSSTELARSNIYMTSVDTGWINDENPFDKATRLRSDNQFQTPIDETDAMARILDPILDCIKTGRAVYGRFLKDYRVTEW